MELFLFFLSLSLSLSLLRIKRIESSTDNLDEIGKAEMLYMSLEHEEMVGDQDIELGVMELDSVEDMNSEIFGYSEEGKGSGDVIGPDGIVITKQPSATQLAITGGAGVGTGATAGRSGQRKHNVLDVPWTAPNIDRAKRYADYVQPRKGGKGGKIFNYLRTTTGRHCCLGGLGEQFDLWQEGQISEFGIYGPGKSLSISMSCGSLFNVVSMLSFFVILFVLFSFS
jgi:hypothetical protein